MTRPADEQSGRPTAAPAEWLRELTVVLFDLDGTLHDDPRAMDRYVTALQVSIPDGAGLGLREEVASVIEGHHPAARPGRFVEPVRGLVLDAPEWVVESATDWHGQPVTVPDGLAGRVQHGGPLRYLGDRWQIITAVAARRGADKSVLAAAFSLTRRFVNDPDNDLLRLDCLDGLLEQLAVGRRLLLATNTPEELARPLVDRLDLRHPFALVRFDARKPAGCAELISEAHRRWGATPRDVLVVGDNLWNDVLPPAEQGCRTVHIDPLGTDPGGRWSTARYVDLAAFAALVEEHADAR